MPSEHNDIDHPLIAYSTNPNIRPPLVIAPVSRDWMDATPHRFIYRCLPMLIANQAGWLILNAQKVAAIWDGGHGMDNLRIEHFGAAPPFSASSHFGSGILTWTVPYLFRTPPGYNLQVRGPANLPKDGVCALEGIVETDWAEATFTMNWKLTRPNHTVVFEEGEPIAMLVPQRRGEIERFRPEIRAIETEPELYATYVQWLQSRLAFNSELKQPNSQAQKDGWQRHYVRGTSVDMKPAPQHQSRLVLRQFMDERNEEQK